MYVEYFGLTQPPFRITPDTNLFYPGGNRGAILEALVYAITSGEGIVKVVGEVGTGKTMLCRMLEVELADNIEVVYLANPSLEPDHIPYAIAFELKLDIAADSNRLQVMNELQNYLLKKHRENGQVVVFVEEAQSMPIASLEELRLLSNLETGQSKLLQIVLFGQPELDERIASTDIRQLKERITYSFQLAPFKTPVIKEYLNARVRACGYRAGELFTQGATREIARYSNGLLRRVNILADKALLAAYATGTRQVKARHVKIAARDSEFIPGWKRHRWSLATTAALATLLIVTMLVFDSGMIARIKSMALPPQVEAGQEGLATNDQYTAGTDSNSPAPPESTINRPVADIPESESKPPPAADASTASPPASSPPGTLLVGEMDDQPPGEISLKIESALSNSTTIEEENTVSNRVDEPRADSVKAGFGSLTRTDEPRASEKLMALDNIIRQQELGEIRYSEKELTMMLQQLEKIPSESYMDNGDENVPCEHCATLIYRPLYEKENL